jgi:hypothetical protein
MSDLEVFALIGIVIGLAAALSIPQGLRVAPLSAINIFGMVSGLLVTSIGFLAFSTNWHEEDAWRSAILIVVGGSIAYYMMNRCVKHVQ